ncbi:hypothetical protein GCU85_07945 [Cardiobacteriales bacterium ML27]|uniref:Uncharacterized protein n=1 Tax=Ostreibacterium oceani TaxID=2654998 RepID=A0A6N7EYM3_9GAMM|nr:hypothetical protein [Ostreibacterium oceani]
MLSELDGFKFPNHLVEDGEKIWVVDTNHHQIVALGVKNRQLSRTGDVVSLSDYSGMESAHEWPSIAYLDDHQRWWVMVNDSGMAHPGFYRLNKDKTTTRFASQLNDASAMLVHDQKLYVGQYPENKVWVFDMQAGDGQAVTSQALSTLNQRIDDEISSQKTKMWSIIAAISVLGIGLLAFAVYGSKPIAAVQSGALARKNKRIFSSRIDVDLSQSAGEITQKIVWIPHSKKATQKLKLAKRISYFVPLCIFIGLGSVFFRNESEKEIPLVFWPMVVLALCVVPLASYAINKIMNRELGVFNGALLIRQGKIAQAVRLYGKDIVYTNNALYAKGEYLMWQNPQYTIYDKAAFEQYAVPVLQQGRKVSDWKLYGLRLKDGDVFAVINLLGVCFLVWLAWYSY